MNFHEWIEREGAKRRILKALKPLYDYLYSECPDCREYSYKNGICEECGITDGYLW